MKPALIFYLIDFPNTMYYIDNKCSHVMIDNKAKNIKLFIAN